MENEKGQFNENVAKEIKRVTRLYGRLPEKEPDLGK